MRKPWTEKDDRRGTRTIRWYTGNKIEKTIKGQQRFVWERAHFACGTDKRLYEQKYQEISKSLWNKAAGKADSSRPVDFVFKAFMADGHANRYPWRTLQTWEQNVPWFFAMPNVKTMDDCNEQNVRDYKALLLMEGRNSVKTIQAPLSPNYIHRRLADLRSFFSWAVENKYLTGNPFVEIAKTRRRRAKRDSFIPKGRPRPRFYNDLEIEAIEAILSDYPYYYKLGTGRGERQRQNVRDFHAMIRMCYRAGMREGEITTARAESIRFFAEGDAAIKVVSLKGGEEKTRMVPLCRGIVELLPDIQHGFLFPRWVIMDSERGPISNQRKVASLWEEVRRFAKITTLPNAPAPTFYGLRHTFARLFLEQTPNLNALAEIMGHEGNEMIGKVYGFMAQSHLRESVNKINWPGLAGHPLAKPVVIGGINDHNGAV